MAQAKIRLNDLDKAVKVNNESLDAIVSRGLKMANIFKGWEEFDALAVETEEDIKMKSEAEMLRDKIIEKVEAMKRSEAALYERSKVYREKVDERNRLEATAKNHPEGHRVHGRLKRMRHICEEFLRVAQATEQAQLDALREQADAIGMDNILGYERTVARLAEQRKETNA